MNEKIELTQDLLKEILHYDPLTGVFTWLRRDIEYFKSEKSFKTWNTRYAGAVAGYARADSKGSTYIYIRILSKSYLAHRVAYFYMKGLWPDLIDHKDWNGTNNKWENLQNASHTSNGRNVKKHSRNSSGYNGVYWRAEERKWGARIGVNKKNLHLGLFSNIDDAIAARKAANIKYGFSKNHGLDVASR